METLKTWVISNKAGREIFFFELFKIDDTLYFDSNLIIRNSHHNIIENIQLLLSDHLPIVTQEFIANQLFNNIKKNRYYDQFYFNESVLNKDGKLNLSNYKITQEIIINNIMNSEYYVPLSDCSCQAMFAVLSNYFYKNERNITRNSKAITKSKFEANLVNETLQHTYVNIYHQSNSYNVHYEEYNTYFILRENKLLFAFKAPK
jgi:hypothetical protein